MGIVKASSIDEVIEMSKIEFPRALNLRGVNELFRRIEYNLRGEVVCNVSYTKSVGRKGISNLSISGSIQATIPDYAFSKFKCYKEESSSDKIKGVEFEMGRYDHESEVFALWKGVKKLVTDHFDH